MKVDEKNRRKHMEKMDESTSKKWMKGDGKEGYNRRNKGIQST